MLNFLAPPANIENVWEFRSMSSLAATVTRDHDLVQKVKHSKPKLMNYFIKARQDNLNIFTTLLTNLIANLWFFLKIENKAPNEPLIM